MNKFTDLLLKGLAAYGASVSGDYRAAEWLRDYLK